MMSAPACAKTIAQALPIPFAEAVSSATWPARFSRGWLSFMRHLLFAYCASCHTVSVSTSIRELLLRTCQRGRNPQTHIDQSCKIALSFLVMTVAAQPVCQGTG